MGSVQRTGSSRLCSPALKAFHARQGPVSEAKVRLKEAATVMKEEKEVERAVEDTPTPS